MGIVLIHYVCGNRKQIHHNNVHSSENNYFLCLPSNEILNAHS